MTSLSDWNRKLMYADTFSLFASHWTEDGDDLFCTEDREPKIVDAPCYLSRSRGSFGSRAGMDRPDRVQEDRNIEECVLVLFCDNSHAIAIGDVLRITQMGETREYIAGAPHKYLFYQELLVYLCKDA